MSQFNIKLDGLKALNKGLKDLPDKVPQVTAMAINEAVDKMYTEAWKVIKPQFFVKQKYFSRATKKIRANTSNLQGALVSTGKHLTMSRFKYSPNRPFTKRAGKRARGAALRQPVTVQLGPNLSQAVPGNAFIARMPTGYVGVFKRVGSKRYPIMQPLSDVGAAEMLGAESVRQALEETGKKTFDAEFKRLTRVQLDREFKSLPK